MNNSKTATRFQNMVTQYTFTLQRLTDRPRYARIKQAEDIVRLEEGMQDGVVAFSYLGQDNEIYHVKGTLRPFMKDFKCPYRAKPYNRFLLYYNLEIGSWRMFQVSGLISITCESK